MAHAAKIAISISPAVLKAVDALVRDEIYQNRSQAIQEFLIKQLAYLRHTSFVHACEQLDVDEENHLAEEGFKEDMKRWPKY